MRLAPVAVAFAIVAGLGARVEAGGLGVVVRVATTGDDEALGRVRGQTSDLDVSLDVARGALEEGLGRQIEGARRLAASRDARVVIWWEERDEALLVYVAEPATGRVLARKLATRPGERSAQLEAAAQIVRSSLRALAAGGTIGVVTATPQADDAEVPGAAMSRTSATRRLAWRAAVGWQAAFDGASPIGQQGLAARLGVERRWLAIDLFATAGLPARLTDGRSTVDLARHAAGIAIAVVPVAGRHVRFAAGVAIGVAGFFRSTVVSDPTLMATPARATAALLVGPEARLSWTHGAIGVELTVGGDAVFGAPELVYQTQAGAQIRNDLWPFEPRVGLALVVRTR